MNLKKLLVTLFSAPVLLSVSAPTHAQWVVFDPTLYLTQAMSYVEQIAQLTTAINQYNQMLTDYTIMLQNLKNLPDTIKQQITQDINNAITQVSQNLTGEVIKAIQNADPSAANYQEQVDALLSTYYAIPKTATDVKTTVSPYVSDPVALQQLTDTQEEVRKRYEADSTQMGKLAKGFKDSRDDRKKSMAKLDDQMNNLGDQSELATLQTIAKQNALSQTQNEVAINATQQLLLKDMEGKIETLADFDSWQQRRLNRAVNAAANYPQGLGKSTWGPLNK